MSERLRVLEVIPAYAPAWSYGGPVRVVADLVHELASRGHEITVFTSNGLLPDGHPARNGPHYLDHLHGATVHYFRLALGEAAARHRLYLSPAFRSYLTTLEEPFDVVHVHEYWTSFTVDAVRWAGNRQIPVALSAHGSLLRLGQRTAAKAIFNALYARFIRKRVHSWVSVSALESRQYRRVGVPSDNITELPNAVREAAFWIDSRAKRTRSILYIGRLHKDKGVDVLLRSLPLVLREQPRTELRIAGPDDGALRALERLARKLGLLEHVKFLGPLSGSSKVQEYQEAGVVAYLSKFEIFGLVPLEALMCGTPVVATRETGASEYLGQFESVELVDYGNSRQTAQALIRVLRGQCSSDGALDAARVAREYGWTRRASEYEAFYSRLAQSGNRAPW